MIRVEAPAKLNLYLHVTGRRADGFHELDSLVTFAALADTLEIAPADAFALTVSGPFAPALDDGDNLAAQAALALAERLGRPPSVRIALQKRIPVAAGLGGGSADAAAVLRGLARLWRLGAEHAEVLRETALGLGADVPVCLDSRAACMAGIGEALSAPPPLPPCAVLLVNPGVPVPTGPVFAARRGPFSAAQRFRESPQGCAGSGPHARHPAQRSGTARMRTGARDRSRARAPRARAGLPARPYVRLRRHLLWPVRGRRRGRGRGRRHRLRSSRLVVATHAPRPRRPRGERCCDGHWGSMIGHGYVHRILGRLTQLEAEL